MADTSKCSLRISNQLVGTSLFHSIFWHFRQFHTIHIGKGDISTQVEWVARGDNLELIRTWREAVILNGQCVSGGVARHDERVPEMAFHHLPILRCGIVCGHKIVAIVIWTFYQTDHRPVCIRTSAVAFVHPNGAEHRTTMVIAIRMEIPWGLCGADVHIVGQHIRPVKQHTSMAIHQLPLNTMWKGRLFRIVGCHIRQFESAGVINFSNRVLFDDIVGKRVNIYPRERMSVMVSVNRMVFRIINIRGLIRAIANGVLISMGMNTPVALISAYNRVRSFCVIGPEGSRIWKVVRPCSAHHGINTSR